MRLAGALCELLGVSRDHVKTCELIPYREVVREPPTLVQLREETEATQAAAKTRFDQSQAIKPYHKQQLRTWHRLKGALTYIRKMDMGTVVAEARTASLNATASSNGAAAAGNGAAAAGNGSGGGGEADFAHKWLGVKDILKSKLSVLKAVSGCELTPEGARGRPLPERLLSAS